MRPEADFTGGARGKYLALYRRWKGITTATGTVPVTPTTTGDSTKAKIVLAPPSSWAVGLKARCTMCGCRAEILCSRCRDGRCSFCAKPMRRAA